MSAWSRKFEETIDQRGELLPPTWCARPEVANVERFQSSQVLQPSKDGALLAELVGAIRSARETVVLASFLIAEPEVEEALLEVAHRGVRVYGVWASDARLDQVPKHDSEFDNRCVEEHKAMLVKLTGWALVRSAHAFHAKALLVDPNHGGTGFLLTANFTHAALTRNEELAIRLTAAECRELFAQLAWAMWEFADHELLTPGRLSGATPLKRFQRSKGGAAIVSTLAEPGTLRDAALRLIESAREEITVACFGWDADHEVIDRLCERARSGVGITVLARERPASMSALVKLAEAGATILGFRWLHAKAIVVDGRSALVMSANLQRQGLDQGFELGVMMHDARVADVSRVLRSWAEGARSVLKVQPALGELVGEVRIWNGNGQFREAHIVLAAEVEAKPVVASSAEALDAPWPHGSELATLTHHLKRCWRVDPPQLAAGAKLDTKRHKKPQPGDPKVYRERGGRIVVAIQNPQQMERALWLKQQVQAAAIVVDGDA